MENKELVKLLLLNKGIDVNAMSKKCDYYYVKYNETPLQAAIKKNNIDIVNLLLSNEEINFYIKNEYGGNINDKSYEDLHYCYNKEDRMENEEDEFFDTDLLIPYYKSETSIDYAISLGNIQIIELLLSNKKVKHDFNDLLNCKIDVLRVICKANGYDLVPINNK